MTEVENEEPVGIDRASIMEILKHAAAHERTNVEFRLRGPSGDRELVALEVTEYVEALEEEAEVSEPKEHPNYPDWIDP